MAIRVVVLPVRARRRDRWGRIGLVRIRGVGAAGVGEIDVAIRVVVLPVRARRRDRWGRIGLVRIRGVGAAGVGEIDVAIRVVVLPVRARRRDRWGRIGLVRIRGVGAAGVGEIDVAIRVVVLPVRARRRDRWGRIGLVRIRGVGAAGVGEIDVAIRVVVLPVGACRRTGGGGSVSSVSEASVQPGSARSTWPSASLSCPSEHAGASGGGTAPAVSTTSSGRFALASRLTNVVSADATQPSGCLITKLTGWPAVTAAVTVKPRYPDPVQDALAIGGPTEPG